MRVDTLSNGRVVVSNPDLAAASDSPVARLTEELWIGRAFGDSPDAPDLFGQPIAVATDDVDNIYVADHQSSDIRVFDSAGNFVRRIGRRGRGPGELQFITGVYYLGRVESPVPLQRSARMVFGAETVTGVVEDAVGAQFVVRLRLPSKLLTGER